MSGGKAVGVVVLLIGLFLGMNAIYTVSEVDQVVVTRFGAPVGKPEVNPGTKFKVPFVDVVNRFDKRFLPWDGDANQMVTADKVHLGGYLCPLARGGSAAVLSRSATRVAPRPVWMT